MRTGLKALLRLLLCVDLFGIAAASASADEVKWMAVQAPGTQRDCSTKAFNTHWLITETDEHITLQADTRSAQRGWRLRADRLNADGSGRLATHHHGRSAWFEFTPGHGARLIYFNRGNHACVWQLQPE